MPDWFARILRSLGRMGFDSWAAREFAFQQSGDKDDGQLPLTGFVGIHQCDGVAACACEAKAGGLDHAPGMAPERFKADGRVAEKRSGFI